MTQIEQLISKIEEKKYNYKAMLKSAEPNSEIFYCYRSRVALCEELLIEARAILKEPASENLEQASKEWLRPQLDKSYADYGEKKMMELTHFDGYAMLDAVEFGAKWQKEQMLKDAIEGEVKTLYRHIVYVESVGIDSSSIRENKQDVFAGDKVKVIIIKE